MNRICNRENRIRIAMIVLLSLLVLMVSAVNVSAATQAKTGWVVKNGNTYYYYASGKYYQNKMVVIKGDHYYFDQDGHRVTGYFAYKTRHCFADMTTGKVQTEAGFYRDDNYRYYVQDGGAILENKTFTVGKYTYHALKTGRLATGVKKWDGEYRFTYPSGIYKTSAGMKKVGGNYYYIQKGGVIAANKTITYKERNYHATANGKIATGFHTWNGVRCFSTKTGKVPTTTLVRAQNGVNYLILSGGKLASNTSAVYGRYTYQAKADGSVYTGIHKFNGKYYYSNTTGKVRTNKGWINWNGKRYYAASGGKLYAKRFITVDGNQYYVNSDGSVKTGTFTIDGKQYKTTAEGKIISLTGGSAKGIDVSYFQGTINWKQVKTSGIKFAIVRAGYRGSSSGTLATDSTFYTNIKGAKANGIETGAYFFTQAINEKEAREEADYTIKLVKNSGVKATFPIVIDTENISGGRAATGKLSRAKRTAVIKAFCDEVKAKGYTPMIYASTSWLNNQLDMSKLSGYHVWVAQYYSKVTYGGTYKCWQYTSSGSVNGIKGRVDMDYWYY